MTGTWHSKVISTAQHNVFKAQLLLTSAAAASPQHFWMSQLSQPEPGIASLVTTHESLGKSLAQSQLIKPLARTYIPTLWTAFLGLASHSSHWGLFLFLQQTDPIHTGLPDASLTRNESSLLTAIWDYAVITVLTTTNTYKSTEWRVQLQTLTLAFSFFFYILLFTNVFNSVNPKPKVEITNSITRKLTCNKSTTWPWCLTEIAVVKTVNCV